MMTDACTHTERTPLDNEAGFRAQRGIRGGSAPSVLLTSVALLMLAHPASAVPVYSASVNAGTGAIVEEGSSAVSLADEDSFNECREGLNSEGCTVRQVNVSAAASGGQASAAAHVFHERRIERRALIELERFASASASFRVDDLIVSPTGGTVDGPVTIDGMNLFLTPGGSFSESLSASSVVNPPGSGQHANAIASVFVGVTQPGRVLSGSRRARQTLSGEDVSEEVETDGLLDDWDGASAITTPSFSVPIGVPFAIEASIRAGAFSNVSIFGTRRGAAVANSDFSSTFGFAPSGPVFNLPTGFTLNSGQANIVDNTFMDARQIPEPPAWALMSLAAAVLLRRARPSVPAP